MGGGIAAHDAGIGLKGGVAFVEAAPAPPQRIALGFERAVEIETGTHEQAFADFVGGGTTHGEREFAVAGLRIEAAAHEARPARQGGCPFARGDEAGTDVRPIGFECCGQALVEHPGKHFAGIDGKMQLQAFLQHLFLHAAQEHDVGREEAGQGDDLAAHAQHLVDGGGYTGAAPEPIAEIDKPVAGLPALGQRLVQAPEFFVRPVDARNRPHAVGLAQHGEAFVAGSAGRFCGRRSGHRRKANVRARAAPNKKAPQLNPPNKNPAGLTRRGFCLVP